MVAATVRDTLIICRSKGEVRSVAGRSGLFDQLTVKHGAQVFRCCGLLFCEVKLPVRALGLVYEDDTLAEFNGRPQLELMGQRRGANQIA